MRLCIRFVDRIGIFQEMLLVFAERRLNVEEIEVDAPNLYLDVPTLSGELFPTLRDALSQIDGVLEIFDVDILPGMRRRLYLDALLAAMADPVLAVDASGMIVVANTAAATAVELSEPVLRGMTLGEFFSDATLHEELIHKRFHVPIHEVMLKGKPFLLDSRPLADVAGVPSAGGLITLHAPSRIGERLYAVQHVEETGFATILGESTPIRALKAQAARAAAVDAPLLIYGETGTGKELVAQACHAASTRSQAPFFVLNCAALPENLVESELFGYAPGAFTGGQRGGKPGLLELANHGTVFLDEIGEMSPYLQAKLLRFLNDGSFRRDGGDREQKVDVRIISATHRNLEQMVAKQTFREDLFYRINVLVLSIPPLRERADDILLLARLFIARAAAQARRPPCLLTVAAEKALLNNPWPGNVRQLQNVIFRAITMSDKTLLDVVDLDLARSSISGRDTLSDSAAVAHDVPSLDEAVERFEKELLQRLYPFYPSSRKLAAHLKTSHTKIADKLRKYGIR
ncbi:MAG TPA: sigma 54-interacting transcriptional regulator [Xanthomonadaceae bacterium]|nr:sigma 54-interacting transcriptional regulator [Xanthomonadaceae bacterium]